MVSANVLVKITGNRAWIDKARKSDNYKGDADDKQLLIDILWKHFHIAAITGDSIETISGRKRIPDVRSTNYNPTIYFEMDGEYHGFGDELTTSDATYRRNKDYEDLGYKLIVINKSDTDGYDKSKIIANLKAHGIRDQRV